MTSVLGIDVGTVRTGLAVSDPTGVIASPLVTLPSREPGKLWPAIAAIISEREITHVVVGLPRRLDGSEGDSAVMAREFGAETARRTGLTVEWWDERFTSAAAERSLIASGVRRAKRRQAIDAVAASLMLQSWLDSKGRSAAR